MHTFTYYTIAPHRRSATRINISSSIQFKMTARLASVLRGEQKNSPTKAGDLLLRTAA